jgi:uncharacterized Zn finger protein
MLFFNSIVMAKDEEVEIECPTCSKLVGVKHRVIVPGQTLIVKCNICGTVRKVGAQKRTNQVKIKVVMSKYDKSYIRWLDAKPGEFLSVGEELIVENEEANAVRISAIELKDDVRVDSAAVSNIRTLWVKAIDEVVVKIAIHTGTLTRSLKIPCSGDKEFTVGSAENFGRITRIKVNDGLVLKTVGQSAVAHTIKRIYAKSPMKRSQHRNKKRYV